MPHTIVYYIDSDNFGGAEQVLYTLLGCINRKIWHPILIHHPSPRIMPFIKLVEGLQVDTLSVPEIKGFKDITNILKFSMKLRAIRPKIFHANLNWPLSCSYGIIAAYLARIDIIIGTQHLFEEIRSRRDRIIQKIVSLMITRYIAISSDLANQLKKTILSEKKIIVVQNGINLEYYSKKSKSDQEISIYGRAFVQNADLPVVLTVARLAIQKGITYLLKAASKVPDTLYVIAGDGPERRKLESEAHDLNLTDRIIFLGERNDIPDLLSSCDLFVLPSIFEGGLALSIMEAMAAGKPVIATDIPGVNKNVIDRENVLLVPPADPTALAEAIKTLLTDSKLANRIANSGKLLVFKEFSAQRMTSRVTNIYMDLIGEEGI